MGPFFAKVESSVSREIGPNIFFLSFFFYFFFCPIEI
jgi:hypothetical protein